MKSLSRSLVVVCIGTVTALALSACGGPSVATVAAQQLAAGIAAQKAGHLATATSYYTKVLEAQPTNAYALYDLADIEQIQKLNSKAEAHYRAALAVDPQFGAALFNLAILLTDSSPSEAKVLYQQVIRISPKYGAAHFNLGYLLVSLGQQTAGLAQINKGIVLDPSLKVRIASTTTTVPNG